MMSLAKPWLARSTILARMTSRYGDVYCRDRLTNSECSSSERRMMNGLFRGISCLHRRHDCLISTADVSTKIRHHIYEWQYLAIQILFHVVYNDRHSGLGALISRPPS